MSAANQAAGVEYRLGSRNGRKFRTLTIINEAGGECLALIVARGPPANIRSDNGSEFIAAAVQIWLARIGVKTLYITPAPPWENGYNESFNGSLRDELLNGEISTASPRQRC